MPQEKPKQDNNISTTTNQSNKDSNLQKQNSTLTDPELAKQIVIEMTSELEGF